MDINQVATSIPQTAPNGMPIPLSVRQQLLAQELLGNTAASTAPIYSKGVGFAKLAAGLASGIMERKQLADLEAGQTAARAAAYSIPGGAPGAGAAPSLQPSAAPSGQPSAGGAPASDPNGVVAMVRAAAAKYGVDPNVATKVLGIESSNGAAYYGDKGPNGQPSSFGPLQLHYGNINPNMPHSGMGDDFTKATGLDARDPSTVPQQIDFAMSQVPKTGWAPWATTRDKLGISNFTGVQGSQLAQAGGATSPPVRPNATVQPSGFGGPIARAADGTPVATDAQGNSIDPRTGKAAVAAPPQQNPDIPVKTASSSDFTGASTPGNQGFLIPGAPGYAASGAPNPQAMAAQMAPVSNAIGGALAAQGALPPSLGPSAGGSGAVGPGDWGSPSPIPNASPDDSASAGPIPNASPGQLPIQQASGPQGPLPGDFGTMGGPSDAPDLPPAPSRQELLAAALAQSSPDSAMPNLGPGAGGPSAPPPTGPSPDSAMPNLGPGASGSGAPLGPGDLGSSLPAAPAPVPNTTLANALAQYKDQMPVPPVGAPPPQGMPAPPNVPPQPPGNPIASDQPQGNVAANIPTPPVRPANLGAPAMANTPGPGATNAGPSVIPAPVPPPGSPPPQLLAAALANNGPAQVGRNSAGQSPTQFNLSQAPNNGLLAAALSGKPMPAPSPAAMAPGGPSFNPMAIFGMGATPAPSAPVAASGAAPAAAPMAGPAPAGNAPAAAQGGYNPYASVPPANIAKFNAMLSGPQSIYQTPETIAAAKAMLIDPYMSRVLPDGRVVSMGQNGPQVTAPPKWTVNPATGGYYNENSSAPPSSSGGPTLPDGVTNAESYNKEKSTRLAQEATPSATNELAFRQDMMKSPSYTDAISGITSYNAVMKLMQDNTAASTKAIVDAFGRGINPGASVRQGTMQMLIDSQSLPQEVLQEIKKAYDGESQLSPDALASMAGALKDKVGSYQTSWNTEAEQAKRIASDHHLKVENVIPDLPPMAPFDLSHIASRKTVATPSTSQAAPAATAMPTLGANDQATYAKMPSGTRYTAPDGSVRIKP